MRRYPVRSFLLGLAAWATMVAPAAPAATAATEPLFKGMGKHHREVTTRSREAQKYFDQGLVFLYAFNHDEAIRSFRQAAVLDSTCTMAWWGIACANGPHINNPTVDAAHARDAWEALRRARLVAAAASDVERELVGAQLKRFSEEPPADRRPLDQAYADQMRKTWKRNPQDADVGVLFAESLMDLRPWDLWTLDGRPQPGTEEILQTLEAVLAMAPDHPGANHLYIHVIEASPSPERALASADRLRDLVPAAGHLVHMPAHIYTRVGRWEDATEASLRAIRADDTYRERFPDQGFYHVYMAHNRHFLSWAAMMQGRRDLALKEAREMIADIPPDFVKEAAYFADGYMTIALEAMMRFGMWEEILREPAPPDYLPITAAHRRFTRAVAFTATNRLAEAKAEQEAFEEAAKKVTPEMIVGNNPARRVLDIARHLLAGEIRFRQGDLEGSVAELRRGVEIEDSLKYNEAPDWIQPVRHTLGGILMAGGRMGEAESVFREDLRKYPENGWSLFGLERCLAARGAEDERRDVEKRFRKVWSKADVKLRQTCMCLPDLVGR